MPHVAKVYNPEETKDVQKTSVNNLSSLVITLLRPYKKWLFLIYCAMSVEALMGLAAPWPLKIIIDNVIGKQPLPDLLSWLNGTVVTSDYSTMAIVAAASLLLFVLIGSVAGYVNSYYTESVSQYVANDLRQRMYHHLQRLSLAYYDTHQIAKILNTITADVLTIQDFASQSILRMVIDAMTIIGMLFIMFYLHWDFALVAVAITPLLLIFVIRFKMK
jgi:ABC-type multidrug transport system fused ATPase/permease subunit